MDDELRTELLRRVEIDQVARKSLDLDGMREADGENLPWLKGVVAEHGWPGACLVGTDGAHAAWLLAQHADADPAFQRQCLDLLAAAVEAGEATKGDFAYLTDRVLLAEKQPQVYGTQVTRKGGQVVALDLRDPDGLDARRAAAGLKPFAEYARLFDHAPRDEPRLKCPGCGAWAPFEPSGDGEPVTVTCPECALEMTVRLKR
ncbi:MAG: DUF6624 domain-containing protein [Trebonia sp.]